MLDSIRKSCLAICIITTAYCGQSLHHYNTLSDAEADAIILAEVASKAAEESARLAELNQAEILSEGVLEDNGRRIIIRQLSAPNGIRRAMRFGVYQKDRLTDEAIRNYQAPFQSLDARKALLKTVQRLSGKGFEEIKQKLPSFAGPVQIIYGERDKILPQVKNTMAAVKKDLPQARQYSFPNCGHFLQEEEPEKIVELVATFMEAHP
ncbi:MAG: alpha/beta hydrolase [Bacteroidota bacterium]